MPSLSSPIKERIRNHLTGEWLSLESLDDLQQISEQDTQAIIAICNQPQVYDWLFKSRLEGSPYSEVDAANFVSYARDGWQKSEKFICIVRDSKAVICGAVDIKSNQDGAEVGYWADQGKRGFMTNSLKKLCELAAAAGFTSLSGVVHPQNSASQGVLSRAGFETKGAATLRSGEPGIAFHKIL